MPNLLKYKSVKQFAEEYANWLRGQTVRNPQQAFKKFVEEHGYSIYRAPDGTREIMPTAGEIIYTADYKFYVKL